MVCPRMGGGGTGNPREFVFKMLHQGRDFGIDNDPLFVRQFKKNYREIIEKSFQKEREFHTKFRPKGVWGNCPLEN